MRLATLIRFLSLFPLLYMLAAPAMAQAPRRFIPPLGYTWFAPLFINPPAMADPGNVIPYERTNVWRSPYEGAAMYCKQANPTYLVMSVNCGPGTGWSCGFACMHPDGAFAGGTVIGEAAICPYGALGPSDITVDGTTTTVCSIAGEEPDPSKSTGCPDCPKTATDGKNEGDSSSSGDASDPTTQVATGGTDPINLGTGNSWQVERDYAGSGAFPLRFERHYNSDGAGTQDYVLYGPNGVPLTTTPPQRYLSIRWKHNYDRAVVVHPRAPTFAKITRPDGNNIFFNRVSGVFVPEGDNANKLEKLTDGSGNLTGWRVTSSKDDSVELYDSNGRLLSITNRAGLQQTLAYDTPGRLVSVTDAFGSQLLFGYNTANQLTTVTDPAAGVYTYAYDTSARLVSVAYPDTSVRQYLYENTSFPHALTAILDEKGARYASWTFDANGKAVSSEYAGGANRVTAPDAANVTDAFNNTRNFALQVVIGVSSNTGITGPVCPSCGPVAQTFDANGNVASRTDWNGNRTNFTYDLSRNLQTSRTEALNSAGGVTPQTRTISTQWDTLFRRRTGVAEPLRITTNVYDPDGTQCGARGALCSRSVQATTDATGASGFGATATGTPRTWTYTYNANGRVLSVNGPRTDAADVTSYTYYANNDTDPGKRGNVATITNALGHTTQITAYNAHGQPLTIVDPNGLTTTLVYDLRRRLTSRTVGGETTAYDYDVAGQLTKVTLPDSSFLSYTYDDAHRMTGMQDNLGNRIAYTLDAMGNRTLEQVFDPANSLAQTRSRVISSLNRLFQEIGATGQTTQYAYDDQGNVTSVTDPLTHTTVNQYDALNRVKQVTDPASGITQYAYNGLNALTQVTDPRTLSTNYSLDGLGNLNQQVSPDTGTTTNTYDTAGNLLTQTDAKGQVTTYVYDALNRVTLITFQDGSKQAYAYDQGANALGRLSSIIETNPSNQTTSIIAYAYEQHGRVITETRTVAGVQYVLGHTYDSSGRLTAMTYPSGRQLLYTIDPLGRIAEMSVVLPNGSRQFLVLNATYHPFGGVNGFTLGNGLVYSRPYDHDGRVSSYTLGAQTFTLAYDAANRITAIQGTPSDLNGYGYDALDRMTSATLPAGTSYSYSYDAVGNRTSKNISGSSETYTYSSTSNRIATLTPTSGPTRSFVFDSNGSNTNDGQNTYAYDTRGRMVQAVSLVGTTTYQVNALGQRIRKTNSSDDRIFHYDTKGKLIAESDPGGTVWKREYIYLGDIPVAVVQ